MRPILAAALLASSLIAFQDADLASKVRRGNDLMAAGKFGEAAMMYADVVKVLPNDPGLRTNLGMAYHLAGQDREAVEQFETALRQQKGIVPALAMLGAAHLRLGEPARAIPPLRELTSAMPNMKEGQQMLAEALTALGQYEEAADRFERWAALDATNPKAWYGLGLAYETLAERSFQQLERTAPESGYRLALVAAAQMARGRRNEAISLYREAAEREPGLPGIEAALPGIAGEPGGSIEPSSGTATGAQAGCGADPVGCEYLAGRYQEVVAETLKKSTPVALYWRTLASGHLATDAFGRIEKLPASPERHAVRARLLRERRSYGEAIEEWKGALKLSPEDPVWEKELAVTYRMNENYAAAQPLLEKLLKRDRKSAELNYLLGQVLLNQQRPEPAIEYLQRAVEAAPDFLPVHSSLGLAYLQLNKDREAVPHLKAALPLDQDGSLHFRLGRAYQKLGEAEMARGAMQEYQKLRAAAEKRQQAVAQPTTP